MSFQWYEALLRLGLAALCGLLVGSEREHRHRPAGIKTHMLVCVGAALVSLIQVEMINASIGLVRGDTALSSALKCDFGRLGAQVISGIGFLGAGTILHEKGTVKGLTTAATLWVVACVGLAAGMLYYQISVIALALTMAILITLRLIQNRLQKGRGLKQIAVSLINKRESMKFISDYCISHDIVIESIRLREPAIKPENTNINEVNLVYAFDVLLPRTSLIRDMLNDLLMNEYIYSATEMII
jgi:putative Mg2+ transporter-C (MgtC) family protein